MDNQLTKPEISFNDLKYRRDRTSDDHLSDQRTLSWQRHTIENVFEKRMETPSKKSLKVSIKLNSKKKKKIKHNRKIFHKRNWTVEEDELLRKIVKSQKGYFNWSDVASYFKQRVGKQCRERWYNHLNDNLIKKEWTEEEDKVLIELHRKYGNKWAFFSKYLQGRTDNMIKNRWNTQKRA